MIFIENTFSPLTVVGVLPDTASIPTELGCDTARLWSNDIVLFALVVPGHGPDAFAAHRDLLEWLSEQRQFICRRRCAFAWVIEDSTLRASTIAWLELVRNTGWTGRGEVFLALRAAVEWLTDTAASSRFRMERMGSASLTLAARR
jgi:hypothetical protein